MYDTSTYITFFTSTSMYCTYTYIRVTLVYVLVRLYAKKKKEEVNK